MPRGTSTPEMVTASHRGAMTIAIAAGGSLDRVAVHVVQAREP